MTVARTPLDVSQATIEQKTEILKYATDVRKFEIERFWQRSLFFWGFIAAAFVAYAQSGGKGELAFLVACFGFCAVLRGRSRTVGANIGMRPGSKRSKSLKKKCLVCTCSQIASQ
jgi:hypothetical protein